MGLSEDQEERESRNGRGSRRGQAHAAGASGLGYPAYAADEAHSASGYAADEAAQTVEPLIKVRKKRRRSPKPALIVLAVLLGILLCLGVAAALWLHSLNASMEFQDEQELADLKSALSQTIAPTSSGEEDADAPFYVLVLGSDARDSDEGSRSDVIMLIRVDPSTATIDLVSIPRDTMVTIDSHGTQKINAAYAYGGAAGAVNAVSEFAGVPISHYAAVHFEELEQVVDALGGVWVDVPEDISAGNGNMDFSAGEQKLNGEQALAFARERYNVSGGDFGRAQAQRIIVEAIINQVLECTPTELPGVISQLADCVTTDYSLTDLVTLAQDFQGKQVTIYSAACPSYSLNVDGVSYVGTMFAEWRDMMKRVDAGLDPDGQDAIPEPQASDEALGAATNSAAPQDYAELAASAGLTTDDVASTSG